MFWIIAVIFILSVVVLATIKERRLSKETDAMFESILAQGKQWNETESSKKGK